MNFGLAIGVISVAMAAVLVAVVSGAGGQYSSKVVSIARAIAAQEGFGTPGARPTRNHNPGDLRYWPAGFPRDSGGFTVFPDDQSGWDWLYRDVSEHLSSHPGQSIADWIASYADVAGSELEQYAGAVASAVGLTPDALLSEVTTGG